MTDIEFQALKDRVDLLEKLVTSLTGRPSFVPYAPNPAAPANPLHPYTVGPSVVPPWHITCSNSTP